MRVIVDFHAAEDDRVWALKSHVRDELFLDDLGPGSMVLLDDAEGHTATGIIDSITEDGVIEINVIWQTWRDASVYSSDWFSFKGVSSTSIERDEPTKTSALQPA